MTRSFDVRTIASAGCHIAGADHSGEADIRRRSVRRALRFVVGILFLVVSCDESLPPRADPNLYLEGRIEGIYVLAHQDNFLAVHIVVTNTYDETLAAEAVLGGRLAIQSRRDPSIVKIVELSDTLVTSVYPYDPFTSQLTLGPGESLRLTYEWDLVDDRGRDLRTSFFRFISDTSCPDRCLAYTEDFALSADVGIFTGREKIHIPETAVSLSYVTSHVNPSRCPPIDPQALRRLEPSAFDRLCLRDTLSL